jgi:peroxiredoxin Q/BCP
MTPRNFVTEESNGIKKGDSIPNFKAKDTNGNDFDSQMLIGQKPLVIYFTQRQYTGCTAQACSFRDQYEDFKDLGAGYRNQ